jgi:hypothetical protein
MSIGKILGSACAAKMTAQYPAIVAWELNASIICARVVRGMLSTAIAVMLRAARA